MMPILSLFISILQLSSCKQFPIKVVTHQTYPDLQNSSITLKKYIPSLRDNMVDTQNDRVIYSQDGFTKNNDKQDAITRTLAMAPQQIGEDFLAKFPKTARIRPSYDQEFAQARTKVENKVYYDPKNDKFGDALACFDLASYNCENYQLCMFCERINSCLTRQKENGEENYCEDYVPDSQIITPD